MFACTQAREKASRVKRRRPADLGRRPVGLGAECRLGMNTMGTMAEIAARIDMRQTTSQRNGAGPDGSRALDSRPSGESAGSG